MEASVAGAAPAITEQPAVQPVAPEPAAAPTEVTPAEQNGEAGLEGAFHEMKASFDQFMEAQKPAEDPNLATDLLSHLEGEGQTEQPAPGAPAEPEAGLQSPEAQAQLDEARAFIAGQVQELVTPLQRELAARDMKALGERYPDIQTPEVLQPLTEQINRMVALTGNPDLIYNADLVQQLYKVVKAEQADAAAVPAEQAATQGASLETHAGQTQAGDPSLSEQYKSAVFGAGPKRSAFE
jgi:hypothetical protein